MAPNAQAAYLNTHFDGMDPKGLILMLYDGAIKHLRLAREGIRENNIPKRGENLSRVIAIVSELNTCLDNNIHDESTDFLRGLYLSILLELPKVSLTNSVKTVDTAIAYIDRLREIWKHDVMGKPRLTPAASFDKTPPAPSGGYGKAFDEKAHVGKSISA
jgi:flagellar protein FliS